MNIPRSSIASVIRHRAATVACCAVLAGLIAGCATIMPPQAGDPKTTTPVVAATPSAPSATAAPGTTPTLPGPPSPTKPFADVIKDAKVHPGYFTPYQKDEKVWIEIKPEQLDQPFFQANRTHGLGERRGPTNPMMRGHIAELHKIMT
jgi:hypothetical protein